MSEVERMTARMEETNQIEIFQEGDVVWLLDKRQYGKVLNVQWDETTLEGTMVVEMATGRYALSYPVVGARAERAK